MMMVAEQPAAVLEEVPHIVRNITVPVKPLILKGSDEAVTIRDLRKGHAYLLGTYEYKDVQDLLAVFHEQVIKPAEAKLSDA